MTTGAPLRNSRPDPSDTSLGITTAPDLRLCELNSNTLTMDNRTVLAGESVSGVRGKTTVSLSCSKGTQ